VLPDGSIDRTGGPAGDPTGYDMTGVIVGAEGTFGVVTRIWVRLTPLPPAVRTLEVHAPGISDRIVARHVVTPADLEREYGLSGGHPMHGEQALDQFFAWRPLLGHARYRLAGIGGLYMCGAGTHPGGGITGGPGRNAARAILADARRARRRSTRRRPRNGDG